MPQRTLAMLNELEKYGFTDADFYSIHHFSLWGRDMSIQRMRDYIARPIESFKRKTNKELKRRLEMVLEMYLAGGFACPAEPGVFKSLCEMAVRRIPLTNSRLGPRVRK